jgi:hypothetical protein
MSKIETILTNYPLILSLHKSKLTLVEICKVLEEKRNIRVNRNTLYPVISALRNNKMHPEYADIAPLLITGEDVKNIEPYSIKFNSIWICFSNSNPKKEWKLTEKTLAHVPDPVGILYMKRFLRQYQLTDEFLLQCYEKKYGMKAMPHELEKIKNIDTDIRLEYENIIIKLKQKNLDYILGGFNNGK